jgi:hypothetical protein
MTEKWHPVQNIIPLEFMMPKPGTQEPYVRLTLVRVTGKLGWKVTLWNSSETVVYRGPSLEDAAMAAYKHYIDGDRGRPSFDGYPKMDGWKQPRAPLAQDGRKLGEDKV